MPVRPNLRTILLAACAATLAACSDSSSGPTDTTLSTAEKAVLVNALASSNLLSGTGSAGSYAPLAISLLGTAGPLGTSAALARPGGVNASVRGSRAATYEGAVGFQVIYTSGGISGTYTGVIGWDGLSVAGTSVAEFVQSGAATASLTPVGGSSTTTIGGTAGTAIGYASYWSAASNSRYDGTSGSFVLTGSNFTGSPTDCSTLSSTSVCTAVAGTISGSFAFGAARASGTGPATYTQSTVTFTALPAIRVTITR